MPVDTGYKIFVYYRATSGDPWGIYGYASGTVNVTAAAFSAISVTAPTGTTQPGPGRRPAGQLDDQRRGRQRPVQHLGREHHQRLVRGQDRQPTGTASYSDSVNLNVPVDTGYKIFVYYRATSGDPWGIYGYASGTVNVTAV